MAAQLTPLDTDLWTTERPLRLLGLGFTSRMTVVRLADGSLFLHSPENLGDPRPALDPLGPSRHIVSPNRFHHLFVARYRRAFPEARFYAAPGLAEKRRDFTFDEVLEDDPPAAWQGQIDQLLMPGAPTLNEVVFYHRSSRSLILTDLAINVGPAASRGLRFWARLNLAYGHLGPSLLVKSLIRDKPLARAAMERMLDWDFRRVIMAHGAVVENGARPALVAAYRWLGG